MKCFSVLVVGSCIALFANSAHADWWATAKDMMSSDVVQDAARSSGERVDVSNLSIADISSGLKEALRVGTGHVVGQLGATDGFHLDPKVHIELPSVLGRVEKTLATIGMGDLTQDLELRLNRAAEAATPKAKALFVDAISEMTFDDAQKILSGSNDSATQYLRGKMGPALSKEMAPLVDRALLDVGAVQAYDLVIGKYQDIPFVPDLKADLKGYVVDKAMEGIFYYVAIEEAKIRQNPAARTTELLKKVFTK